ncbi:putative disease resistance protein RGA4 [Cinnamomum micranthum f. kanehirae]|uniref:Putative disease resistance protein RGA4 n=1 Tax=Cinnamomum micranthum f. kanehirae TaxID=337451 RepID=A0A3S3MG56_9MAGN|nr:putative disease resistance protein RGA4 [Cinnamomum micranthum f. kanehirae]
MEDGNTSRSHLKRPLPQDDEDDPHRPPMKKRPRFPKGKKDAKKAKTDDGLEEAGPVYRPDPRFAANERKMRRKQITKELIIDRSSAALQDVAAGEVNYEGNTMQGVEGNYPMVQGVIKADTGAIINLGTQVNIAVVERQKRNTTISHIVQVALDKARSCLQIVVDLFLGAENHLVKIKDSLVDIHKFIVIAERSPLKDPKLMELLEKLKDAAYDAVDLLEDYEIAGRRRSEEAENSMTDNVRRVVISLITITPVIKLRELSQRLKDIKAECGTFQLKEKVTEFEIECKKMRETHSYVPNSQVIGRDREKKEIVTFLLSTELDDVSVIAIVGSGGLGKTTLAQWVFNDDAVQNHFYPKMWICVSDNLEPDNFDIRRLGNKILERATDDRHNLSDLGQLQCRLQKALGGKRCLLVLDDIWNENFDKWHESGLRNLLFCGGKGSRIVVTTRSLNTATIMSTIQPYSLKRLSENDCWSLFCLRAFGNPIEEAVHPNLTPIGRDIVKKCSGIPLAVTTRAGLLYNKRTESRWESVRDSEMWGLPEETEKGILPALRLSYNYLRPHLKQCFAFCAIFPRDYEIENELVIKLWMAHGFIPTDQEGLMELEDISKEICNELVMRCFFQDVSVQEGYGHGRIPDRTTFRMHGLMHDLAHSVMENEYRVVLNGKSKDISPRIRHISSNGLGILAASLPKAQKLRTYVMLKQATFQFPCDVGLFKCLRVLDFIRQQDKQKVEKQLFTSLGNLQHLRYLNLSFTLIERLPESLTSLYYLQTLILRDCEMLCELPKEMCKLTNLRCLDITNCDKLTHMPPKMGQLSCLQELSNFIVGRTNEIACSGIGELQGLNLRGRLRIQLVENIIDAIDVPRETLINKRNLTYLDLMWNNDSTHFADMASAGSLEEDKRIEVLENLKPHRDLKKLGIFHYGGLKMPSWLRETTLTQLVDITLSGCWRCNHLPPLGELRFLKVLEINGLKNVECIGNEFYGNEVSGGFPSLEKLVIEDMEKLKTWSGLGMKGEREFPSLNRLEISSCPMLTTMEFFPDIKDLNVDQWMMQSLKNLKSFESMHQQNCNQSSFADEDQIRSQSSLQVLMIQSCDKLIFSGLRLRYLSSLSALIINGSNEFAHVAHELSFLTSLLNLWLGGCQGLKSLPEGIGNLTSLRCLSIHNCPEMASLPRELQRLSALKELYIFGCPTLEIRCTKDTGEDWDKIQHIPLIRIGNRFIARD